MSGNLKVNISMEADEFIKAIKELTECIDQLTEKMNHLKQTTVTINVGNVKTELDINKIVRQIEESLAGEIDNQLINGVYS